MQELVGMTYDEIASLLDVMGIKSIHARTLATYLYKKRITDLSVIPNLSAVLKDFLNINPAFGISGPVSRESASDGTIKYLFRTDEGKEFETVYIPGKKRNTLCVSVQAGCRMGCKFCATGQYGFHGNLTTGEIISQVLRIPEAAVIDHVVFMGMGEPLDNLENVIKACSIMTSEDGMAMGSGNITVSSVGLNPAVEIFMRNTDCNFTLSLYSPFPEERSLVLPVEKNHPVHEIIDKIKGMPLKRGRRLTLAYVMIKGQNDTDRHLEALIGLARDSVLRINLLPFHTIPGYCMEPSPAERMQYFKHNLIMRGISASVRKSRGTDISAACGLLATTLKRK